MVENTNEKKLIVILSRVRDIFHENEVNASSDFLDALNDHIIELCKKVVVRCKGNGRKTAKPVDL